MLRFLARLFRQPAPAAPRRDQRPESAIDAQEADENTENLVVLRQAVLTRDKKVAGYVFVQPDETGAWQFDSNREQSFLKYLESVMASAMLGKRRAFTTIPGRLLFDPLLEKLARAGVIVLVRVGPDVNDLARVAERMQAMRNAGMRLGLADARIALAHPALGNGASLGFLPVDQIIPPDLLQAVRILTTRYPQMQLCASGVNTHEEFEVCRRLRMHGFIGPFATHRRDWQNNRVDPGTLRLCKLVNSMRAGAEMDAVIKDIKLDPLLSYRILVHANSAVIGAQRKILALKDAILLIGREPLFRWLVLLLCASAPSRNEDGALLENALARGRMMEMLAGKISSASREDFFLTGVLSLLDVILQLPANALFDDLDLPAEVKVALLERKGPYAGLLRLAEASEQAQIEGVNALCAELGIEPRVLNGVQAEALNWAKGQSQGDADEATFVTADPAVTAVQDAQPALELPQAPLQEQQDPAPAAAPSDPQFEAAQRGEPEAQCAMGGRYARGDGVAQDFAKSLEWYTMAAQQGDATAQWNVAVLLAHGQGGIDLDPKKAALWCQKAVDQGFAPAQATLGRMYAAGEGVEKDVGKALALFQLAALQGDMEAQYNLAVLHEQAGAGEPNLEQAAAWFSKAAEQGLAVAQVRLGLMYAIGQPMKQDLIEAHKWFFIASKVNHGAAEANLEHSLTLMEADQVKEAEDRATLWMQEYAVAHAGG